MVIITIELFSYKKANLVLTREQIFYNLHQVVFYKLRRKTIIAKKAILITKCVASNNNQQTGAQNSSSQFFEELLNICNW